MLPLAIQFSSSHRSQSCVPDAIPLFVSGRLLGACGKTPTSCPKRIATQGTKRTRIDTHLGSMHSRKQDESNPTNVITPLPDVPHPTSRSMNDGKRTKNTRRKLTNRLGSTPVHDTCGDMKPRGTSLFPGNKRKTPPAPPSPCTTRKQSSTYVPINSYTTRRCTRWVKLARMPPLPSETGPSCDRRPSPNQIQNKRHCCSCNRRE